MALEVIGDYIQTLQITQRIAVKTKIVKTNIIYDSTPKVCLNPPHRTVLFNPPEIDPFRAVPDPGGEIVRNYYFHFPLVPGLMWPSRRENSPGRLGYRKHFPPF